MKKPKFKTMYMHTIDGRPGIFERGIIWFASREVGLVPSLAQIRKERRQTEDDDLDNDVLGAHRYGHVRVRVPA